MESWPCAEHFSPGGRGRGPFRLEKLRKFDANDTKPGTIRSFLLVAVSQAQVLDIMLKRISRYSQQAGRCLSVAAGASEASVTSDRFKSCVTSFRLRLVGKVAANDQPSPSCSLESDAVPRPAKLSGFPSQRIIALSKTLRSSLTFPGQS